MQEIAKVYSQVLSLPPDKKLKHCMYVSGYIRDFTGQICSCIPRHFQVQGILLMRMIKRFVLADDTGLGKTLEMLYAYAYMLESEPDMKVMWVGPKSTLPEKVDEFKVMLHGVKVFPMFELDASERKRGYKAIERGDYHGFVTSYGLVRRDYQHMLRALGKKFILFWDEATAFKSLDSQTHLIAKFISDRAERVVSASATIIKNHLEEAYAIWKVTNRLVLPADYNVFRERFCSFEEQWVPIRGKGPRKMNVFVGYKNLSVFRASIQGHFIGRTAEQVGEQLPPITFKEVTLEMGSDQEAIYWKCINGLLEKHLKAGKQPDRRLIILEALRISLSLGTQPEFFDSAELFSKEAELIELLQNEFLGEKVIIYSESVVWINRMMKILIKHEIKAVRITGEEDDQERQLAKNDFNKKTEIQVMMVSRAGGEGINLTAARIFIFAMLPWSYGDMKQLLGRYRRIGSKHSNLLALFLMNAGTEDYRVLQVLKVKKELFDQIFNDSLDTIDSDKRAFNDIWDGFMEDAKKHLHFDLSKFEQVKEPQHDLIPM